MTYQEVLTKIHSRKAFSSSASLERISRLMYRLGDPQERLRCIHIAGTNGKGSISAMVESVLRHKGYRVGLFTSPYLREFRERIQIDRQMISEADLIAAFETVMAAETALEQEGYEPINEFELVTAMGFTAFAAANVDYAVIEVGLGGRCDATNVMSSPAACCIASISLDHTLVLGNTPEEIALEKAGIMKPGCPVVLARQTDAVSAVLSAHGKQVGSPVIQTKESELISYSTDGLRFSYDGAELQLPLLGKYQMDNAAVAWEVCRLLGCTSEEIVAGLQAVSWPGRLQYIPGTPGILIDAGHNPAGITGLCSTLDELFGEVRIHGVMAMMRDKDYAQCIPMIAQRCKTLIATTVGLPRSLSPEELAAVASPFCKTIPSQSVSDGIELAKSLASPEDLILVCGSVYAAGAALNVIS